VSSDENRIVHLDAQQLIQGLITVSGHSGTARALGMATSGVAAAVFIQTFVVEPSIWWFRIQSLLLLMFSSATMYSLVLAHRRLMKTLKDSQMEEL
jgi:hypothetical protein